MPDWKSLNNKWLKIRPGVILTLVSDNIISNLDPLFEKYQMSREVSSGKRDQIKQMDLVINEAIKQRIPVIFDRHDFAKKMESGDYVWQDTWSRVLSMGFMVAPPFDAKCKYDYKRPLLGGKFELIKAGTVRIASGHFYNDFDISGSAGNQTQEQAKTIEDELRIADEAIAMDIGIKSITPEKVNNALHFNVIREVA